MMRASATLSILLLAASAAAQGIPQTVPYQGYLTDADGVPISGEVAITFRLYGASQGGQARWEERHAAVAVDDGVFVVQLGDESPISSTLRETPGGYLAIQVEDDAEATPRQKLGAVPYALLAYDSERLGGVLSEEFVTNLTLQERNYLTREQILELINQNGGAGGIDLDDVAQYLVDNFYLTQAQILELIGDGQGITIEALALYLEENGYVTFDALAQYLVDNDYLTREQILALLDGYVTEAELNARGFLDEDAVAQVVDDAVAAAVADAVENLQGRRRPYILGVTNAETNGRVNVGGHTGLAGAAELCRQTYANEATVHMCTPDEINIALSMAGYSDEPNFDDVVVWAVPTHRRPDQTCQSLLYNSGDAATGTAMRVDLNYQSVGNGGNLVGPLLTIIEDQGCGNNRAILCCR